MGLQNYLRKQSGQIIVETLILCTVMGGVLLVFAKLAEFQREQRQGYYFSRPAKAVNADIQP